jgi:catechol 2,3-dioxygenase-like lactoylglutathione lyase family enzyme
LIDFRQSASALAVVLMLAGASTHAQAPPDVRKPAAGAMKLLAATIECSDLGRSSAFYTKGLGLTAASHITNEDSSEMPSLFPGGGSILLLIKTHDDGAILQAHSRIGRVVLAVPDLKALQARLTSAGYKLQSPVAEQKRAHVLLGVVKDPDGNELELVQPGA